jgi:hypothetical protein
MNCSDFENLITRAIENELDPVQSRTFAEHRLACIECRELFAEVGNAIKCCNEVIDIAEPPLEVISRAIVIPILHPPIDCERFVGLVTEFLDGYLEPTIFQAFHNHAEDCEPCSEVLAGVALAVSACHSVHFSEELDVPDTLVARILAGTCGAQVVMAERHGAWARLRSLLGLDAHSFGRPRYATGALILAGFLFFITTEGMLTGSSLYQNAARLTSQVVDRSSEFAGEVDRIRTTVDDLIDTIESSGQGDRQGAGESSSASQGDAQRG